MKQHLIDSFNYNDWANRQLLETIKQLPEKQKAVELFSHFIHAQDKWYNRITKQKEDSTFAWMTPVLPLEELEAKWMTSVNAWLNLLNTKTENQLQEDVIFNRAHDGKAMAITLADLCLQLNYHSIHHRAQINTLMSQQGIKPPATDYIFTKLREL